jgi:magnesium chelatase subunit D
LRRLVLAPATGSAGNETEPIPRRSRPERRLAMPMPDDGEPGDGQAGADAVLAAARAAIPPGLLDRLKQQATLRRAAPGRSGGPQRSGLRGRPAGTRAGALRAGERLNVLETLRAAAPWQAVRRRERAMRSTRRRASWCCRTISDRALKPRTRSTTIFVVDASGSARCTASPRPRRDRTAAGRVLRPARSRRAHRLPQPGRRCCLPPTRSLARRGGTSPVSPAAAGTPLTGIDTAAAMAHRRAGRGKRLPSSSSR